MIDLPRRTINDLFARYELEPSLKDVYVEGVFDKDIISCCYPDRIVYEIDSVEISTDSLNKYGLTEGNKQRVITLAQELRALHANCAYRCLIDRDLDHWFGDLDLIPRLVWTEYCSLELYFYTDEILKNLLITTTKSKIIDWEEFSHSFLNILQSLYSLRLTDRELGWSITWLPVHKYLKPKGSRIELSLDEYINQLLIQNAKFCDKELFNDRRKAWLTKFNGDPRYFVRGHNFIELIAWSITKFKGISDFSSSKAVERLLVLIATQRPKNGLDIF